MSPTKQDVDDVLAEIYGYHGTVMWWARKRAHINNYTPKQYWELGHHDVVLRLAQQDVLYKTEGGRLALWEGEPAVTAIRTIKARVDTADQP